MQLIPDLLARTPALSHQASEPIHLSLGESDYLLEGIPIQWQPLIPDKILKQRVSNVSPGKSVHLLRIRVVTDSEHLRPRTETHNLNETSRLIYHPGKVEYISDWCEAQLQLSDPLRMDLDCHVAVGSGFAGVLENALRIMVAYDVLLSGGLLMHSSAIVISDKASVLFGHSGAGKSTTSQIAMNYGYGVLSDDINVLLAGDPGWRVCRVPFCGSIDSQYKGPGIYPLAGLFRLQKSDKTALDDYSSAQAVSVLCGSAPFVNQDPFRADMLLDRAEQLLGSCPVKKLYFTKDQEFLDLIREIG
jgi:hypothetical protein